MRGAVRSADRIQRIWVGVLLMSLNIAGLLKSSEWMKWSALAIQLELISTGLAGWCPIYWCWRRRDASMST